MPVDGPLRVFTDGACSGNPGPGGWAWASSPTHFGSGGDAATTNNRMELTAVLRALEDNPGPLVVVCPHQGDIDEFVDELALFTSQAPEKYPAWESLPSEQVIRDEVFGDRLRLLKQLNTPEA